ncbi:tetratricopeptide repeat protein [Saccharicrinis sp. FJH54]|uniref:tetratricopeptide repeat protein n=1 Tax=Saccharicrinis sp. FJH54 TaxID=3344665 RepID=UPI0035D4C2FB
MLRRLLLVVFISTCFMYNLLSQTQDSIVDKGIKLYDEQKYPEAIEVFKTVDENDSAYTRMLYELAITHLAEDDYNQTIETCQKGMTEPSTYDGLFLATMATAFDNMGKKDSAISYYSKAIAKKPFNYLNHYNLGYTYYNIGDMEKATKCFQEALRCNPFHATSHLFLGIISARQHQLTKAMLSLETYLMVEPNSSRSNKYLVYLDNIAQSYVDTAHGEYIEPFLDNTLFEETDHLIASRIVITDEFEPVIDFSAATVKQTQLLFDKLPFDTTDKSFWVEMYFPFFKSIKEKGYMAPMLYTILTSTKNNKVQEWKAKNENLLKEFYKLGSELTAVKNYRDVITPNGIVHNIVEFDNDEPYSIGAYNSDQKEEGYWQYFNNNGGLKACGNYINGEKNGTWLYYTSEGNLEFKQDLTGGKVNGMEYKYFPNGKIRYEVAYIDDIPDGIVKFYNKTGQLDEINYFKDGTRNGPAIGFYDNGDTSFIYNYLDGEINGLYKTYHYDQKIYLISRYKNGKEEGEETTYHPNGNVSSKGSYINGKETGLWQYFSDNNILLSEYLYNDTILKSITQYYENGKIQQITPYNDAGNIDGELKSFDREGNHFSTEVYEDGSILKLINYTGDKERDSYSSDDMSFEFVTYYPDGPVARKGNIRNGKLDGTIKDFWRNGNLKTISYYKDGTKLPREENYYINGTLIAKTSEAGTYGISKYETYYNNSNIKSSGYLKDGSFTGQYLQYNPLGQKSFKSYYVNNEPNGWSTYFLNDTIITSRYQNKKGDLVRVDYYDEAGNIYCTNNYDKKPIFESYSLTGELRGSVNVYNYCFYDTLKWFYPNGNIESEMYFFNDQRQGDYNRYYLSGKLRQKGKYRYDKKHGLWVSFYENGLPEDSSYYIDDNRFYRRTSYYENGKIQAMSMYINDEMDGYTTLWDYNGNLQIRILYKGDEIISYQTPLSSGWSEPIQIKTGNELIKSYFPNGKIAYEMQLKDFCPNGEQILYAANGKIISQAEYSCGSLNGKHTYYYANGNVKSEGSYIMGDRYGLFSEFYENGKLRNTTEFNQDDINGEDVFYDNTGKHNRTEIYFNNRFMKMKE